MRFDESKRGYQEASNVHSGHESAPVMRDEARIDHVEPAERSQSNMSDDPRAQAVEAIREEVAGWGALPRMG